MKIAGMALTSIALACAASTHADDIAESESARAQHAVFVMTNDAESNEVIAYERTPYGTLQNPRHYRTGGRGSGGTVDPLASQGSLTLSDDSSVLFAVNAGSGTVSTFRVSGSHLALVDRAPTGGSEPNAVAQHGNLVYVLNTAGSSSVVGFRLDGAQLSPIPGSLRFLSGNFVNSSSLAFSGDGRYLVVTERTTNNIDVFRVLENGELSSIKVNKSAGAGAFSAVFAANGAVLVSETGAGGFNDSAISSYSIAPDGSLLPISTAVPTLGAANCWNVVTPDGKYVYAANAATSSIAGFSIGANGALQPLPGTIVAQNPPGSANLDIAISVDGRNLYSLNAASGAIGMFEIRPSDGLLVSVGLVEGLPARAGLNGIAAN